ncbi:unnamed protein product [Heterosigma akashiwo]
MASEHKLVVSDHFPLAPKRCKKSAKAFFECFSQNGEKKNDEDSAAGRRGLQECQSFMEKYDKCMVSYLKKNPPKTYRVQKKSTGPKHSHQLLHDDEQ